MWRSFFRIFGAMTSADEVGVIGADDDQLIDVCALLHQIGYVIRYRQGGDLDIDIVIVAFGEVAIKLRPNALVMLGLRGYPSSATVSAPGWGPCGESPRRRRSPARHGSQSWFQVRRGPTGRQAAGLWVWRRRTIATGEKAACANAAAVDPRS